ncbi:MAG: hypothetical protein ACI8PZ_003523 [Myxococcota bacterium]|jgi:hypothetical protein
MLKERLEGVAARARTLPWADRRPWRPQTHVGWDGDTPALDLHDLNVKLALEAVRVLGDAELDGPEVWVITGRGKHTGGVSRLRQAVGGKLRSVGAERGWRVYADSPGRIRVVLDPGRVARRPPSLMLLFVVLALSAAMYATWPPLVIVPPLFALLAWLRR